MITKRCKQCGELKPIEQFRKYYGGRKGTYTTCKTCEKINSRAKYLRRKGDDKNPEEKAELEKIEKLYEVQRAVGLRPPHDTKGRKVPLVDSLDDMISKYATQAEQVQQIAMDVATEYVPSALSKWLTEPLVEEPEYYLDEVYEDLTDLYRPKLRIDTETLLPVYDNTYLPVLDKILERFNDYEDEYYNIKE